MHEFLLPSWLCSYCTSTLLLGSFILFIVSYLWFSLCSTGMVDVIPPGQAFTSAKLKACIAGSMEITAVNDPHSKCASQGICTSTKCLPTPYRCTFYQRWLAALISVGTFLWDLPIFETNREEHPFLFVLSQGFDVGT